MMKAAAEAFPAAERQAYLDPLLAVKHNQNWNTDLIICEFSLRIIDGIQLIKLLRQQNQTVIPILLEPDGSHSRDADNLDIPNLTAAEPSELRRIWKQERSNPPEKTH
jgi:CheY-like chemotaxis protein